MKTPLSLMQGVLMHDKYAFTLTAQTEAGQKQKVKLLSSTGTANKGLVLDSVFSHILHPQSGKSLEI